MAVVIILPAARQDRFEILLRVAEKAGPKSVSKYSKRFTDLFAQLADFPASCQARPKLGRGIRVGSVKPYLVIYHYAKTRNTVTVLRIMHAKRNITKHEL
jgi:toxin ParE1/3/4